MQDEIEHQYHRAEELEAETMRLQQQLQNVELAIFGANESHVKKLEFNHNVNSFSNFGNFSNN